jgi:C-terminal processing protease CtpA/Prc
VRGNGGGSSQTATSIAQHFLDRGGVAEYIRFRSGPGHEDFGPPFAVTVAPEGARRFAGRVALLTDRRDFSAAESFVLDMRVSPRVTVVGDTTAGASGRPLVRELPNGWTYRLSTWVAYTPGGEPYEGIGLPPDVPVRPRSGDWSQGIDRVLETAWTILRTP